MSISMFRAVKEIERSVDYHALRHSVISANVANAETPGYKAFDVSFKQKVESAAQLRTTNSRHLSPGVEGARMEVFADPSASPGANGNAVSLEREMAKMAANSLRYQASVEILRRRMGVLKYAANNGQGRL